MKKYFISKNETEDRKQDRVNNIVIDIVKKFDSDIEITINYHRTTKQHNALHLWFSQVADALNEKGIAPDVVLDVFKTGTQLQTTPEMIKNIWKSYQKQMFGTDTTLKLNRHEQIDIIFDIFNLALGEKFGIHIPFPDKESLKLKQKGIYNNV